MSIKIMVFTLLGAFLFAPVWSTDILRPIKSKNLAAASRGASKVTMARGYDTKSNITLANPVLFSLVVPPLTGNNFGHQLETFTNHLTGMQVQAPRGGDLCMVDAAGNLRYLTKEAGYGVISGQVQASNAIAVRQPSVHWTGSKALFSMVVGGPTEAYDQDYRANKWQIYEITNLADVVNGTTPTIVKVANQPDYHNISPIYGSDGHIIFTSDSPLFGMTHAYPQLDEYESSETNTGIFKLLPATGKVTHLTHSPSGDFDIQLATDGRIISTRWEHLKRDQQAISHRAGESEWQPWTYTSEASNATIINAPAVVNGKPFADAEGTPYEIFPEALEITEPNRDPNESLHDFNEFLPWEISENGEGHRTVNHVGRHEFGGVFQEGSKIDDSNLVFELGNLSQNTLRNTIQSDSGIFQIKEDPRVGHEGTFYGAWSREFARFSSGRIFEFALPIGRNPQDMELIDWTNSDIDNDNDLNLGHFRNPLMTLNGTMLASYTPESNVSDEDHPYTFRLVKMIKKNANSSDTEHIASAPLLGAPIEREIVYWGDSEQTLSSIVNMSETGIVEIISRTKPSTLPKHPINPVEKSVLNEEGVHEQKLRAWMIKNNLALIAIRDITERDAGEKQQPFNLRVPGGVSTTPVSGKIYDISHFQIFAGELLRSYGQLDDKGRRTLATPLRDNEATPNLMSSNLFDNNAPVESAMKIGLDGSVAAFVPATRALTWQTVAPDGEAVVRERQWLTFAPGEIRTCEGCHGINDKAHSGNSAPQNKPQALRDLLTAWKTNNPDADGDGLPDTTDPDDDNDGLPDTWEESNGLNPYDETDAQLDNDSDGLNNTQEFQAGTDPHDEDTDSDGVNDGTEVANGTDPTKGSQVKNTTSIISIIYLLLLD